LSHTANTEVTCDTVSNSASGAAEQRTLKTRAKIERAVEELLAQGSPVTAVRIA
jgi:hypothetical protein